MEENKIIEQFKEKFGIDLNVYTSDNELDQDHVTRVYKRQQYLLETYCKSFNYNFNYDKLSNAKKEMFNDLVLEQIYYVLNNFDFSTLAGFDFGSNSSLPLAELRERYVSPIVKEQLKNSGFVYRGLW